MLTAPVMKFLVVVVSSMWKDKLQSPESAIVLKAKAEGNLNLIDAKKGLVTCPLTAWSQLTSFILRNVLGPLRICSSVNIILVWATPISLACEDIAVTQWQWNGVSI